MGQDGKKKLNLEQAIFASGCFWSKEYFFSQVKGVVSTRVGYTGGHTEHPTYKDVCSKKTGHAEAVEVTFDADRTRFEALARLFFEMHDPTIDRTDKGGQYRSAIFYLDEKQKQISEALIRELKDMKYDVKTQLEPAATFWPAEARHQKYCDSRGMTPKDYRKKRFELVSKKESS
jgi:peptide methionine sulfoxide reductase msrA/msrB